MLNIDDAIEQLDCFFSETWHRTEFTAYTGRGQRITITILDGGPSDPLNRYCVRATAEDGRKASGNNADTVKTALQIVTWAEIGLKWTTDKPALQHIEESE